MTTAITTLMIVASEEGKGSLPKQPNRNKPKNTVVVLVSMAHVVETSFFKSLCSSFCFVFIFYKKLSYSSVPLLQPLPPTRTHPLW